MTLVQTVGYCRIYKCLIDQATNQVLKLNFLLSGEKTLSNNTIWVLLLLM